jgi:hypothetical protein
MTRFATLMLVALCLVSLTATAQEKGATENLPLGERLPPKIHKIQKELPAWLQKSGNKDAAALMQKMRDQFEAKNFEEVEKTADSILKMMGASAPDTGPEIEKKPVNPRSDSPEETTRRLTKKVERVMEGAQKWAASGRDPAEIAKIMQEKFQPLMQAGKVVEAEAVVDGVLKRLGVDVGASSAAPAKESSDEERVLIMVHLIQKELPAWVQKTGKQAEADAFKLKLKEQLAAMNYVAALKTADSIMEMMGLSAPADAHAVGPRGTAHDSRNAADPFAAFFPQQLVFLARDRIALTKEQYDTLCARVNSTQPRLEKLKIALEREAAALAALSSQERADEKAILVQLDKFVDVEREAKRLQIGLGVLIQNLLTSEQKTKLRELIQNPEAVAKLEQETGQRIAAKVERITAGAQKWAESGRDPSVIGRTMEEKVRPLMETGRVFEAEAELDRVLELLQKDPK